MISLVIPVGDEKPTLEPLLAALGEQRLDQELEVIVPLRCGCPRARAAVQRYGARPLEIPAAERDPGDIRNRAAAVARGELLAFMTPEVLPAGPDMLTHLVAPLGDPAILGVSGRVLPSEFASAATRRGLHNEVSGSEHPRRVAIEESEAYRTMESSERRELYIFHNQCAALRRSTWERLPFPRARFGEDLKWGRLALETGGALYYEPRAAVVLRGEPSMRAAFARARVDSRLLREELGRPPVRTLGEAWRWARREAREDAQFQRIYGGPQIRRSARGRRHFEALGAYLGARESADSGEVSQQLPVPVPGRALRILHVIHGFPPESSAGTEVACLALARAQRAIGHDVCVFTRSPDPRHPEFSRWRDTYMGLEVHRVAHHLEYRGGIQDTFQQAEIERVFQEVLQEFSPDVVHFQHLIHLSVTLVPLAARAGAATAISLHDYWPVCPRVQMRRPDGELCRAPQRLGCYLCVKRRWLSAVRPARLLSRLLERPLQRWVHRLPLRSSERISSDLKALYRRQRTLRRTYRRADLVLAPSRYVARIVARAWRWPGERVVVVENGLEDPQRFAVGERPAGEGRLRVGFLGSLVDHKGVHLLVRAVRRLPARELEVRVHGPFEPDRDPYHEQLAAEAAGSCVRFIGAYDNAELPQLLAGLDAVVLPSLWSENSPMTLLECAAAGVPVLAPRLGGFREKLRSGRDGWFFRPGSARSLRRRLAQLLRRVRSGRPLVRREPEMRDVVAQARELEWRYRSALLRRNENPVRVLFERWGKDAEEVLGVHEVQGRDYLLLRPIQGGAAMYYWNYPRALREDLEHAEPAELEVELMFFAGEGRVPLGAAVFFNGVGCGEISPALAGERDESRAFRFPIQLNGGQNRVRIENLVRGERVFTRLRRIRIVQGSNS